MNETETKREQTESAVIDVKIPAEMKPMIENIRSARAAVFESTTNTSIVKAAIVALHEKVVKG